MALMIKQPFARQYFHINLAFRFITTPLASVYRNLMPLTNAVLGYAKHVTLHATVWKILKNKESKLQNDILKRDKAKLYAKIGPMLKLLIVKTSSLGDVIHNLPVIHDLCIHYPNIKIDWIVEESFADVPRLHPNVNKVITLAIRRWRKNLLSKKTWQEIFAFRRRIRQEQYDLVIDTQGLLKSGLIAWMIRGEKHGYDKNSIREPLASLFYNVRHSVSRKLHAVTRNRHLAAKSLSYQPPIDIPEYGIKALKTPVIEMSQAYAIGLHGTSRDSKLWPTEYWIALGQALAEQKVHLVLPWASKAEHERATAIARALDNATVLPKLSIAELAGVISHAKYAIGVDTGLSHLAVALGVPTIAIYTDTDPALTGVLAGKNAPAINLGHENQIPSVQDVLSALQSFF